METQEVVSKGDFARRIGVTPGRVSQYIAGGKLHGAALDGEGRTARIVVAEALRQLKRSLDAGQMTGNGLGTRLGGQNPPAPTARSGELDLSDAGGDLVAEQIKLEKLRQIRNANRRREEEDRAARGEYTRTAEVRAALRQTAARVLTIIDGGLVEIASAISARFEMPQRDVLHLMRTEFRKVRERGEAEARRNIAGLPETEDDQIVTRDD